MSEIDAALAQVKSRLHAVNFVSGTCYFAADACRELKIHYNRQLKHIPQDEVCYFPKRDTVNVRPRHRVMVTERGLRAFVEIAARKGKLP
ncbi:MAG TPA: hypothetical protein VNT52_17275 [Acidimicrobiales bacterium]|nr:hypothetical protein [Acidimicrobiales bacterium]